MDTERGDDDNYIVESVKYAKLSTHCKGCGEKFSITADTLGEVVDEAKKWHDEHNKHKQHWLVRVYHSTAFDFFMGFAFCYILFETGIFRR